MRLLDTASYQLRTFLNDIPPYAILSHVWAEEEVTFQDISNIRLRTTLEGWTKLQQSCQRAQDDGWKWIWIDTCCINKTDPTELGEAINSMFRWYEEAEICYAYLVDVPPKYVLSDESDGYKKTEPVDGNAIPWTWHFRSSRWFTRGWTLQELLAPHFLLFLDREWTNIGAREELAGEIENVTGIATHQLSDFRSCSIAAKMSWAAGRQTTREEDRAYSLLGLFDVNMPLIYGEGKRAFLRLQKELIENQNDESILASDSLNVLADSPDDFKACHHIVPWPVDPQRKTFSITNLGVALNAQLFQSTIRNGHTYHVIQLNCRLDSLGLESTTSPVLMLVEAEDKNLEVFSKTDQGTVEALSDRYRTPVDLARLVTFDRKNVFIKDKSSKQQAQTARAAVLELVIRLIEHDTVDLYSRFSMTHSYFWLSKDRSTLPESAQFVDRSVPFPLLDLDPGRANCYILRLLHSSSRPETILIVLDGGSSPPRIGLWLEEAAFGAQELLRIISILPVHQWPTATKLSFHSGLLEATLMPYPAQSTGRDRQYRLKFEWVPPSASYTGAIGRYMTGKELADYRDVFSWDDSD